MRKMLLLTFCVVIIPILVVTIFVSRDDTKYHYINSDVVRVKDEATGEVEKVPLEDYVKGVLAGEMPVSFEIEALKAQAVASRSYVLIKMRDNKDSDYDVVNTTTNQVYLTDEKMRNNWKDNYDSNLKKIWAAVQDTSGEYLSYNGEIANALFFSTSSGMTENSEDVFISSVPYLRSVSSDWDKASPKYEDTSTYTLNDFYDKLGLEYNDVLSVEVTDKSSTGRPKKVKINGTEFTSRDLASKLGLRSSYLSITENDKQVTIVTKGFGHGVGMSQYGAEGMAKEGYKYNEILVHYYEGTEIKKI